MAKFFAALTPEHRAFIARQKVFFVATAAAGARISLSPKGLDCLRVLDERTVAYLDLTGSGAETAAHLRADPRMTLMFCSFSADALILRLYGQGESVRPDDARWAELAPQFPDLPGARQIVLLHVESLQTSCGAGLPLMGYAGERGSLTEWLRKKGPEGVAQYQREKNAVSIDGLPTGLGD
ncbi:MAG: pyridoxamine 5'-phosphate oxidase family protein [Betaproteobacteria bacterium]|nr:pyridoxamine 5'-phosphate oxidase family protein [Betaproteobacteria bacterium]